VPFVSKAHKRKFEELLEKGTLTQEQYDRMEDGTPDDIPEHGGYRPLIRRGPNKYKHIVKEEKPHGE